MPSLSPFKQAAAEAVAAALGVDAELFQVTTPPDPAMGDLAVGVFPAAKALKAAPPALAQKVVAAFQPTGALASARAAGPYVNFTLDRAAVYRQLFASALGGALVPTTPGAGKTVCVDFGSPNVAKPLAYHHIRSTTIGHALVRMHRALGYRAVGINHLGDWGTTFGMIIAGIKEWGEPTPFDIAGLNALYVRFRNQIKEEAQAGKASGSPTTVWEDKGRRWFKKLEDGDPEARALWQRIRDVSWAEFDEIYQLLGITYDEVRGESAYEDAMPAIIAMLDEKQLTSISEDALVVDLSAENMPPCLLRKQDGATLYATRDLAAAFYRWNTYHFDRSLYVVDKGQSLHFQQFFTVLKKAGVEWWDRLHHVSFGQVRMGGKKTGTRTGNVVLLKDVFDEAQAKVAAKIAEINPDMPLEKRTQVARVVGVGAVVFGNLQTQREKDIDFEMDAVTSFEGDAAPYIQYAHARCASVLRKAGDLAKDLGDVDPTKLTQPEEWALARLLGELPDTVAHATAALEPHQIGRYLLDVCAAYSRWWSLGNKDESLRIIAADPAIARARLALAAATRETLREGLALLGLGAPDEM